MIKGILDPATRFPYFLIINTFRNIQIAAKYYYEDFGVYTSISQNNIHYSLIKYNINNKKEYLKLKEFIENSQEPAW